MFMLLYGTRYSCTLSFSAVSSFSVSVLALHQNHTEESDFILHNAVRIKGKF